MDVRRVVTGHNENGESCVLIDDFASNATSRRPGHDSRLIWVTDAAPAPYDGNEDAGAREVGRPPPESIGVREKPRRRRDPAESG